MFTAEGRAEFERLIARERAELDALTAEHERLSAEIMAKRARLAILDELLGSPTSQTERPRARVKHRSRRPSKSKKISRVEQARRCLEEAGMSLYVGEILRKIDVEDTEKKRNSLASQLMRYVKDGRIFVRDEAKGSRYFGLKSDGESSESVDIETPHGRLEAESHNQGLYSVN